MSFVKSIETIQRIDFLVRTRSTGSARQLGQRLGVSRRSVHNYLGELRELGAPVSWSYTDNSYVYTEGFRIELKITHSNDQANTKNLAGR